MLNNKQKQIKIKIDINFKYKDKSEKFTNQQKLKTLLKEYGLQQYLRKFYDFGYDDSNYLKLSLLSQDKCIDIIQNLNIFPGHKVKFINMIENLKKIVYIHKENEKPKSKKSKSKSKTPLLNKRKLNKPINLSELNCPNIITNKPKTVESISQRQQIKYHSSNNINHGYSKSKNYDSKFFEPSPQEIINQELFQSNINNYDLNNYSDNKLIVLEGKEKVENKNENENNHNPNNSISDITKRDINESKDCINDEFIENFNVSEEFKINDIESIISSSIKIDEKNELKKNLENIEIKSNENIINSDLKREKDIIKSRNEKECLKCEYIRIVKSFDGDNISHDINNFNVEYLSRCFALMIKKYIEDSSEKFHISELINERKKIEFFNSDYNDKYNLFTNFFDMNYENKKSNLNYFEENENHEEENILNKKLFQNINDEDINKEKEGKKLYFGHLIFNNKNIDKEFPMKIENKSKNNFEYKNELIIINNFFNKTNKENFQFKNLKSRLGVIHEIDSIKYCKENLLDSLYSKKPNNISINDSKINLSKLSDENMVNELNNNDNSISNQIECDLYESNYIIDIQDNLNLKEFLKRSSDIFDDDFEYNELRIINRKLPDNPNPNLIFEFIVNVMIMTKMEKEIIIITLIYLERFIFNSGILITSRNWKRLIFTSMIIASKFWDDDSFENNHFSQVFNHLTIEEINLLERTFLELINYKIFVKFSEYFKYFFIIKLIALKLNFDGENFVSVSLKEMMQIQEFNYLQQKKENLRRYLLNNSTLN